MTRPSALWLTAAAVLVGYFFGWVLPQCMDKIVSSVLRSEGASRLW